MLSVGSLFSGIGGLDLGLERAGMEIIWQVEKDEFCRRVLEKHWPTVTRHEDVKDVGYHNLEEVDLICGGFPCQPISRAGKRKAKDDARWLWPEFARVVSEIRPGWVLLENTDGLPHRGLGAVLSDLAALGYDAEWESITASYFSAPHQRERIFLVAYPNSYGLKTPILRQGAVVQDEEWDSQIPSPRRKIVKHWFSEPVSRTVEPWMGGVVDGVPNYVDRIKGLGNAVVPQVAEWLGRQIIDAATALCASSETPRSIDSALTLHGGFSWL